MTVTIYELDYHMKHIVDAVFNRHEMHRNIQRLLGKSREESKNVYRVVQRNNKLLLYVYTEESVKNIIPGFKKVGEGVLPEKHNGEHVCIDALVAPVKTVTAENGKKIKIGIYDPEERIKWCKRKAEDNGFSIGNIREVKRENLKIDKHNKETWSLDAYEYQIDGYITNEGLFKKAMLNGVGRGGAYGLGMMVIV